jgi:hypothetical protein
MFWEHEDTPFAAAMNADDQRRHGTWLMRDAPNAGTTASAVTVRRELVDNSRSGLRVIGHPVHSDEGVDAWLTTHDGRQLY